MATIRRGAYIAADWADTPAAKRVVIIGTGSEVALAMGARDVLAAENVPSAWCRYSTSAFDRGTRATARRASPRRSARGGRGGRVRLLAQYVGLDGTIVGIDAFGESAPASALFKAFRLHR